MIRAMKVSGGWMATMALFLAALLAGGCVAAKPEVGEPVDTGLLHRAQVSYAEGRYEESLQLYGQSINERETVAARLGAGVVMMAMDRPELALREFTRAVALAPGLGVAHANRGLALAALGRGKGAEDAFDNALRANSADPVALNGKGCLLLGKGEVEEALVLFSAALKADPNNADIHYNRALGFHRVGLHADAAAELDKSLAVRPGHAPTLAMRGVVSLELGETKAALGYLDKALELEPEEPDFFYNRGLAHQGNLDYAAAIDDYTRAMVRAPAEPLYYVNRGECRILDGSKEAGCEDYRRACELGRCERLDNLKLIGVCVD